MGFYGRLLSGDKPTTFTLGEIQFSEETMNEASFNSIGCTGLGKLTLYVYNGEGPIPHFHLIGNNFESCICLYQAKYFIHSGKTGTLNSKQRKELNEYLHTKFKNSELGLSVWESMCVAWDFGNGEQNKKYWYKKENIQPDYTNINGLVH